MPISFNAELERRILQQVESGRYSSPSQVVEEGLDLIELREKAPKQSQPNEVRGDASIWEEIAQIGEAVPAEAWSEVPTDLSKQVDHYLYGAPKRPE
jgi:Arc/MetJ-type ribon-helix-helix transcriptional regulator